MAKAIPWSLIFILFVYGANAALITSLPGLVRL
jgi:hypothetical protein